MSCAQVSFESERKLTRRPPTLFKLPHVPQDQDDRVPFGHDDLFGAQLPRRVQQQGGRAQVREQRDEHPPVQLLAASVLVAQLYGRLHVESALCRRKESVICGSRPLFILGGHSEFRADTVSAAANTQLPTCSSRCSASAVRKSSTRKRRRSRRSRVRSKAKSSTSSRARRVSLSSPSPRLRVVRSDTDERTPDARLPQKRNWLNGEQRSRTRFSPSARCRSSSLSSGPSFPTSAASYLHGY